MPTLAGLPATMYNHPGKWASTKFREGDALAASPSLSFTASSSVRGRRWIPLDGSRGGSAVPIERPGQIAGDLPCAPTLDLVALKEIDQLPVLEQADLRR